MTDQLLKKLLARLGKGAATVDLQLDRHEFRAGENIHGEIVIEGGEVAQNINHLAVRLMMNVGLKQGSTSKEIAIMPILSKETTKPTETKIVPFDYKIPTNIPISRASVSYFFDTYLDIASGVDRKDIDKIIVLPQKSVQTVLDAFTTLRFRESATSGKLDAHGQEFSFFPTEQFSSQINEVELRIANEDKGLRIWMEVDCKQGYKEIEARREFKIDSTTLLDKDKVAKLLQSYIEETVVNPFHYSQPFSFYTHTHDERISKLGSAIPGMVGGLAVGVFGGMLINELMDDFALDELFDGASDAFEEEASSFGDFFGGNDNDF